MEESFGSSRHGAGRLLGRKQAIKASQGRAIERELAEKGIIVPVYGEDHAQGGNP